MDSHFTLSAVQCNGGTAPPKLQWWAIPTTSLPSKGGATNLPSRTANNPGTTHAYTAHNAAKLLANSTSTPCHPHCSSTSTYMFSCRLAALPSAAPVARHYHMSTGNSHLDQSKLHQSDAATPATPSPACHKPICPPSPARRRPPVMLVPATELSQYGYAMPEAVVEMCWSDSTWSCAACVRQGMSAAC